MKSQKNKERETLRRLVEAVDEIAEDDQLFGPRLVDLEEELEENPTALVNSIEEDYNHVVRTAGYVPLINRTTGDKMTVINYLDSKGENITVTNLEKQGQTTIRTRDGGELTHNQVREKIGLDPNPKVGKYSYLKMFDVEGDQENILHEYRRRNDQSLEQNGFPVKSSELVVGSQIQGIDHAKELRKKAGIPYEPISRATVGTMTGERESEVFEFWVEEYLERDWEDKEDYEIDTIMKMSMTREGIEEWELDEVASEYKKWLDMDRYV